MNDYEHVARLEDASGYWRLANERELRRFGGDMVELKAQTWKGMHFHATGARDDAGRRIFRAAKSAIGPDGCACSLHQPEGWVKPKRVTA